MSCLPTRRMYAARTRPERRPERDAAEELVAERLEIAERERGARLDQRAGDRQRGGHEHDDDDVRGHHEGERARGDGAGGARLREDAERGRGAAA